jgi:hypothetical protein
MDRGDERDASRGVALFAGGAAALKRLERALPDERTLPAATWREFQRMASNATCAVISSARLDAMWARQIAEFRARMPTRPVVLVTDKDADSLFWLKDVVVDQVVWTGDVDTGLAVAVARACSANALERIAAALECSEVPAPLRQALAHACRASKPPGVMQLAAATRSDRRTLARQWRSTVADGRLRLEHFLAWLLLIRTLERRASGLKWAAVADSVDAAASNLERTALRLMGRTLRQLERSGVAAVVEEFGRQVVSRLLSWRIGEHAGDDHLLVRGKNQNAAE